MNLKEKRHTDSKNRYLQWLNEAIIGIEAQESYSPGIFDAGEGPSVDMNVSMAQSQDQEHAVSKDQLSTNCFVVIPFRPPSGWYAACVVDVDPVAMKLKLDWLFNTNNIEFHHK